MWPTCNHAVELSSRPLLLWELPLISLRFDLGPSLALAPPQGKSPRQDVFIAVHLHQVLFTAHEDESLEARTTFLAFVSSTTSPNKASLSRCSKKSTDLNEDKHEACSQPFFLSLCQHRTWPHHPPIGLAF